MKQKADPLCYTIIQKADSFKTKVKMN